MESRGLSRSSSQSLFRRIPQLGPDSRCICRRFGATRHLELLKNGRDVVLDCLRRQVESFADLRVG